MQTNASTISLCRHCRYYLPEGRRGGHCQKLNVAVRGHWRACSLATSPFAVALWQELEGITWRQAFLSQDKMGTATEMTLSTALFEEEASASIPLVN